MSMKIVGINDDKRIEHPDIAITVGIAGCVALGIINKNSKLGYLGHYETKVDVENDPTRYVNLLDSAINEASDINDLFVGAVGIIPASDSEMYTSSFEDVKKLHAYGNLLKNLTIEKGIKPENFDNHLINEPSNDSYFMEVNTEDLKIYIRKEI